jgi:hypothetical protein
VKFSLAISTRLSRWRRFSFSIRSNSAGSVADSGAFSAAAHARVAVVAIARALRAALTTDGPRRRIVAAASSRDMGNVRSG